MSRKKTSPEHAPPGLATAPSASSRRRRAVGATRMTRGAAWLLLAHGAGAFAESFDLGKMEVSAAMPQTELFGSAVTAEEMRLHEADNLAQAVDLLPGVALGAMGGRNETTVSIRGFDARRTALFVDGVPVYVPYDGNLDYARFLVADAAQITAYRGFSPLAYGSNTMGGVINVVTRKPARELEGDLSGKRVFDRDGSGAAYLTTANVGAMKDGAYVQLSAAQYDRDHFLLPAEYEATSVQPKGSRLNSDAAEHKLSAKAGYLFDRGEVAIGYLSQQAEKGQPPVTDTRYSRDKYWIWPQWDKESLYLASEFETEGGLLRATLYRDTYQNRLEAYDDATYTTMDEPWASRSRHDDETYGARLTYERALGAHQVQLSANYKEDLHKAYEIADSGVGDTLTEEYGDRLWSVGVEGSYRLSEGIELLGGVGYDLMQPQHFHDTNSDQSIGLGDTRSAVNPQAALIYRPDALQSLRASVARKNHMPTMKERYSRKLGQAVANPDLDAERATHYELAWRRETPELLVESALFYAEIDEAIQPAFYDTYETTDKKGNVVTIDRTRNENVGDFMHRGLELALHYRKERRSAGLDYAYVDVASRSDDSLHAIGVPEHALSAFVKHPLGERVSLYANGRYRHGIYSKSQDGVYYKVPPFATFDLKLIYTVERLEMAAGVTNLTDRLYAYDLGFPAPGRELFAEVSYRF